MVNRHQIEGSYNNSTSLGNNSATSINDNSYSSPRQQVDEGIVINHQEENYITSGDTPSWVQQQNQLQGTSDLPLSPAISPQRQTSQQHMNLPNTNSTFLNTHHNNRCMKTTNQNAGMVHTSNNGKPQFTINQKLNVVQKVVAHEAKYPGMSLSLRLSSMSLDQYPTKMVRNWLRQKDDLATAVKVGCGSKHTLHVHVKRKMQSLDGSNDAEAKKKVKGMVNDYNLDDIDGGVNGHRENGEGDCLNEKRIGTEDDIDNRIQYDWNDVDQQSITVNDSKNNTKDSAVSSPLDAITTSWVHF